MKNVYILTPYQAEELKAIQNKISCDVNLAREELQGVASDSKIYEILDSIESLSQDMEDILASE